MVGLEIIKQLQKLVGKKILQVHKLDLFQTGYGINDDNKIIWLSLYHCKIRSLKSVIYLIEKLRDLTQLHLSHNNISDISALKDLIHLTHLNLSHNKISDISAIEHLPNLSYLDLSSNYISNINSLRSSPILSYLDLNTNSISDISILKNLSNLKHIDLSNNQISDISTLKRFPNLKHIDLSNNQISDISKLEGLPALTHLDFSGNLISELNAIKDLTHLTHLNMSYNKINNISILKRLTSLIKLNLSRNQIINIDALKDLYNLNELNLSSNPIDKLESWITEFNTEIQWKEYGENKFITFYDNPLISPPIDIVKQGKEAIQNYFTQIEKDKGETEYLFEAKMLVIGEGGTGKTTFIRKMQDVDAELPQAKDTTFGIEVGKWNYSILLPKIGNTEKINFHINLWDFGGQKIYQGTHQIFFSEKSFYVLVADTRDQKTDFSYWLNTVKQLGGDNSFLIIVLNKKFGHEQKFDESGYRNHFGKLIKEVVEIDLQNDKSKIVNLQEIVKLLIKQLVGIGDPLPASWVKIREDLLLETTNFISFDRFREICSRYNITDSSIIHTLSSYFNRIGSFTHYIDDSVLQERIYLNSNWLVKTIYEVLDNATVKEKKGRLSKTEIKKIWKENELHYEINKLTQLMHKFGLLYHIQGSDNYVVPAHLPTVTPYEQWEHAKDENILQFIYEFDKYMPQGIMSHLIVALNHYISNHNLVWNRGVNIESNGSYAEIIESYGGVNRFKIRIAGTNKVELLAILRERFAEILKLFKNLHYKQLIPCICEECKHSDEPAFHEYNKLLGFREKGKDSQCINTGEIISVDELLKITEYKPYTKKDTSRTIKIFLASSLELEKDRKEFREFISVENDRLIGDKIYLKIIQWEYFIDAMAKDCLQVEYNKAVKECDIFLCLFFTKVGKFTYMEFETALEQFKETGKPLIYTYFKKLPFNIDDLKLDDINSVNEFEEKLQTLGHYKSEYTDINDLKIKFKTQLENILPTLR